MKNALNNQVGMLGDMFLWLVANLKQGVIYFIKQALPPNISAGSVRGNQKLHGRDNLMNDIKTNDFAYPTHIIIFHCFLRLGFFHRTQIG